MAVTFTNAPIEWDNEGTTPPAEITEGGFVAGYKPPAEYFNAIFNRTAACINELQTAVQTVEGEIPEIPEIPEVPTNEEITELANEAVTSRIATAAEIEAATSTTKLVTPSGMKGYVDDVVETLDLVGDTVHTKVITACNSGTHAGGIVIGAPLVKYGAASGMTREKSADDYLNNSLCLSLGDNAGSGEPSCVAKGECSIATRRGNAHGEASIALFGSYAGGVGAIANSHGRASGDFSIAIGSSSSATDVTASGLYSIAIGQTNSASYPTLMSTGIASIAIGNGNNAYGNYSMAMNNHNTVYGEASVALGSENTSVGNMSFVCGGGNEAKELNFVIGKIGKEPTAANRGTTVGDLFVIGNGLGNGGVVISRTNAFRVTAAGDVMGTKAYAASGADYAEMFEWKDGNKKDVDRRGLFVTLDGEKIKLATSKDDYILGVVSATPSVISDAQTDDWSKKWKTDIFGERLLDENGAWILSEEFRAEDNEAYVSRTDRKEWSAIGMVGKLIAVDDGTCEVNGYCYPAKNGIATKTEQGYRVIARLDETHIKIVIK